MADTETLASGRVAVVVRTKDRPAFLRRALADIDAQTFTDYAVVVVNDAGDPEQVNAVVAAAAPGVRSRTVVVHRERSTGMEAASNAGLVASASEYCCIHDDDDLWDPRFLERTVDFLDSHPETVMVAARVIIRFEEERDGEFVETGQVPQWENLAGISLAELLVINKVVPIGLLYRRSLHDELGPYDESLPVVGDWEFNLRVALRHPVELLNEPLAFWCQRPKAVGAAANSVFGSVDAHRAYDLKLRDAAIREHLAGGASLGPYLFQAHLARQIMQHTDERLDRFERLIAHRTNPLYLAKRAVDKVRGRL